MTEGALSATLAANVQGLEVTPLAAAVEREAAAPAPGRGEARDRRGARRRPLQRATKIPLDLSSCELRRRNFRTRRGDCRPASSTTSSPGTCTSNSRTSSTAYPSPRTRRDMRSFGRTDFRVGTDGRVERLRVYAPSPLPLPFRDDRVVPGATPGDGSVRAGPICRPAGRARPGRRRDRGAGARAAAATEERTLGVLLAGPFTLKGNPESALGNLVTGALLESFAADVAIHNVTAACAPPLPAGELTFGSVYEMFPFDNRVVILELTGRELREVIRVQVRQTRAAPASRGSGSRRPASGERRERHVRVTTGEPVHGRRSPAGHRERFPGPWRRRHPGAGAPGRRLCDR